MKRNLNELLVVIKLKKKITESDQKKQKNTEFMKIISEKIKTLQILKKDYWKLSNSYR